MRERGALQVEWRWGSAAEGRAWREVVSERLPGASHLATALPSADARLHSCGMRLTVSKPNQLVHWESPLVAAQRAEGFVSFYSVPSTGACCVGSNEDEDEDEDEDAATTTATAARAQGTESVYRMSPVDVQRLMCYILQAAMEQHADMVAVHSASAAATGAEEGHRAKLLATRTLITLRNAALSLYGMRERVLSGGEAWTRFEMFQVRVRRERSSQQCGR
ncbi:hypothetical protein EON62_00940 [archaeon]|nr:MAG: hypothetical protein EON62_00940 [archaeon]